MLKFIVSYIWGVLGILGAIVIYSGTTAIALILYGINPFLAFVVIIPGAILCYLVSPLVGGKGKKEIEKRNSFMKRLKDISSFSKSSLIGIAFYTLIITLSVALPSIIFFIILSVIPVILIAVISAIITYIKKYGFNPVSNMPTPESKTDKGKDENISTEILQNLKIFYEDALLPELSLLEEKRKEIIKRAPLFRKIGKVVFICGVSLSLILFLIRADGGIVVMTLILSAFLFLVIGGLSINLEKEKAFRREFKDKIIQKLLHSLNKDFHYSIDGYIPEPIFLESRLFQKKPDWYAGEDYVSGMVGKTKIEFSEIDAQYQTKDSKGREHFHQIFKGLLFMADFNKNFHGETILLPDIAENIFGDLLGSTIQSSRNKYGELVKLEDPEFENFFVVYSSDQIEARYILSTSLMKRLIDFRKKAGVSIYVSFISSKIYIAMTMKNYFEHMSERSVLDFKIIQEYYEDLQFLIGIVEDLNLNTRIWSKQ